MKKALLLIIATFWFISGLHAIQLSDFLNSNPVGQQISEWKASKLVPDDLIGKTFQMASNPEINWQMRFFTFEDREMSLLGTFADFVSQFGLEELESKKDAMPYNDGTFESFTFKDANAYLESKGLKPLPSGVYFVISFRNVSG